MKLTQYIFIILMIIAVTTKPSFSTVSEVEIERRAKKVEQSLRCVVCQNQSIAESDAALAKDMRQLVRSRIRSGDSDEAVLDFMQTRYGDYVLLKPPVQKNTFVLWIAPFAGLILFFCWLIYRSRNPVTETLEVSSLSSDEKNKLNKLKENIKR